MFRAQKGYGDENEDEPKEETRARETTREDESEEGEIPPLVLPHFFSLARPLYLFAPDHREPGTGYFLVAYEFLFFFACVSGVRE